MKATKIILVLAFAGACLGMAQASSGRAEATPAATGSGAGPLQSGELEGLVAGWYSYQRVGIGNTIQTYITNEYYLFFPDGHVYEGVPKGGLQNLSFGTLERQDPAHCGIYQVRQTQIAFRWAD